MQGGLGADYLDGSGGNDTLVLSVGRSSNTKGDSMAGGSGTDLADASYLSGSVAVDWSMDGAANDDIYVGGSFRWDGSVSAEKVQGTPGNDTILGSSSNNTLVGGSGADSISGVGGNDYLEGDSGNDTLDGGSGNDTIDGGSDNDSLIGGDGTDSCLGQAGVDRFRLGDAVGYQDTGLGGSGTDILETSDSDDYYVDQ
jgi:Ca2+-binding RTX toxin-like protein